MPIIKSAIKRVKQAAKRRDRNVTAKRNLKSAVKAFMLKPTAKGLQAAQSEIDTMVKKNILEKRTAARRMAGLSKIAKTAGVKIEASKKTVAAPAKKPATKAAPVKKAAVKTTVAKKAPVKKPAAKKPAAKK